MSHHGESAFVYTDGACKNQGLSNAKAGYGVYWGEGHPNNRSGSVTSGNQDSNRGELQAAQQAIKTAARQGYSQVTICSDSTYVRDAVANSANFARALDNRDLQQSINALKDNIHVNVQYVQGHSGSRGNDQAHALGNAGVNGRR